MLLLQKDEATAARRRIPIYLVDATDGVTPETSVTVSAGDVKISKDGGGEANHGGTLNELAGGMYYYEATAGELDTLGFLSIRLVKSGVRTFIAVAQVVAVDLYDDVRAGLTALPNAAAEAAGGLFTRGTGAGQINQPANGQIDAKTVDITHDAIDVDAIKNGAISAAKFAAGAIDAAAIAQDAIDADAIKADAITEIQAGMATATNVSDGVDAVADYIDAVLADTIAELPQGQPPKNPTPLQALMLLYMALRNASKATATLRQILDDAGTVIAKAPMSDDTTTFDQGKLISGA